MKRYTVPVLVTLLALGACTTEPNSQVASAPSDEQDTMRAVSVREEAVQEIIIEPVGDEMKFATTEFTVKAGTTVKLTMKNTAKSPAMQHNVVVLKPASDINAVGMAGMQAGAAKQYVPESDAVLFATAIAMPGETKSVEFTAPPAGDYPFICTFPGHFALMKGVMHSVE
ncbi:MAG: plastocyanin/azurin family copper-binding protein [Rhodothermales bacterium]|nr:plastocyanin/azurin family copper-binding protein [Rhodothermales bacterium]